MDNLENNSLTPIIFEHACKNDFKKTVKHVLENKDFVPKLVSSFSNSEKVQVKPVFILMYLLENLHSSDAILKNGPTLSDLLSVTIDLLETTFSQFSFISLKKYFTLISELKLLDLLNLFAINKDRDFSTIAKKLNHHFPRWTPSYRLHLEKRFLIDNSKILDRVEESHAQCRRLILKLSTDHNYREVYLKDQYINDHTRIAKESREYIREIIKALQFCAGSSKLEMMMKDTESFGYNDLNMQLLLEYIVPDISDDTLAKFLKDLESTMNFQSVTGLASCLLPFDSMSEDEDSESSESEYEYSQSGSQPTNSQEVK